MSEIDDRISCPYCSELIMSTARKCKHCNEWLEKEGQIHDNKVREQVYNENIDSVHRTKKRDIGMVILLSFITLGIYSIFLYCTWARDINALLKRDKYSYGLILILAIISTALGFFGIIVPIMAVILILYAFDLQTITAERQVPKRSSQIGLQVIISNVVIYLSYYKSGVITGGEVDWQYWYYFLLSIVAQIWILYLIQAEINKTIR